MNLSDLVNYAISKELFQTVEDYIDFSTRYLSYIATGLQARIVSRNENHYEFFQYRQEGDFNITRPINSLLLYDIDGFPYAVQNFRQTIGQLKQREQPSDDQRNNLMRTIYTLQQCIGATLDALPGNRSNQARKVNGDLFERLICLIITSLGVDCLAGTVQVPIRDMDGTELFKASYQHDLLLKREGELKVIGSVKTSSKDRIDKVFMDKFLYSRLTETSLPPIAIFLNDVQRKKTKQETEYGINATFLPGHFKAYTIKLNALDGVYYCDIRPNMINDAFLSRYIKTIDHFLCDDLWRLLHQPGQSLTNIAIEEDDEIENE